MLSITSEAPSSRAKRKKEIVTLNEAVEFSIKSDVRLTFSVLLLPEILTSTNDMLVQELLLMTPL